MFEEKTLLYCTPFYFNDGNNNKPKYFLVLKQIGDNVIVANLLSSKNYVPFADKNIRSGCTDFTELNFKCYCILKDIPITNTGFSFPLNTFIYGKWVEDYKLETLSLTYRVENEDYDNCGRLNDDIYIALLECLKDAPDIKRKYKKMIADWLV